MPHAQQSLKNGTTAGNQSAASKAAKAAKASKASKAPKASNKPDETWQVVNRVVYPVRDEDLTMPLYCIEWTRPHLTDAVLDPRVDTRALNFKAMNKTTFQRLVGEGVNPHANTAQHDVFSTLGRTGLRIQPGQHVSLCTFFNAFPASYWRRWTNITAVRFVACVQGHGQITLFRSTGRGLFSPAGTIAVDCEEPTTVTSDLDLHGLMDGGYFWFDAKASESDSLTVSDAAWSVPVADRTAQESTTLSIAITTFNRAPYCMNQLKAISAEAPLRARLDTIFCTDQGTDLVKDQPDFDQVADELGPQLTYIRQANFGGSGGFSRGMYETLKAGTSSYTLLLDDDAISEPESILRAVQFADYCKKPTIVGGGMLHLDNRTVLYTQGERFTRNSVWMAPSDGLPYNHDFAAFPLRDSPERHRRVDSDFNGWWMCLIPTAIMKDIGLSLPVFIKFDDTEYGLRALEHGYHTVCLPGVAVWHQAWHDKDPSRTWEEYFFQRNRWICALLHEPKPSLRFMYEMFYGDVNVGLKFVYSALKLRHMGLRDIMRGPQYIVDSMPGKLAEVREARQGFADTTMLTDRDALPEPRREFSDDFKPESFSATKISGLVAITKALLSRGDGTVDTQPDIAIPARDAFWRSYDGINSAVVTSPDGSSIAWCRRDSKEYRKQIKRGLFLSNELRKRWEQLSEQYRAYDMASVAVWQRIFESGAAKPAQ
ncbi:glycosyltransferase [Bifidobacterium gallicum]|uniref:Glycosyl transferase family 2 n=1 Tax=Bifidobacterium gallicum DSM 20093 = LMG 11596 TaxID=561180 RepID=A0A087AKS0_9BIFI|nr:glycosyltransferase [Bifidobacterium gallicum]KFI59370.1 glycosyl transferase family 2 [Bifidobacterium gallicum DSM 20093 = LMG 11596]